MLQQRIGSQCCCRRRCRIDRSGCGYPTSPLSQGVLVRTEFRRQHLIAVALGTTKDQAVALLPGAHNLMPVNLSLRNCPLFVV